MKNFGYTVNVSNQVDYDANDFKVLQYVRQTEPSFDVCIGCGTCSATCTAAAHTTFNIRKIYSHIKRGDVQKIESEISKCMLCGKCILVCPRGVNTRNVIISVQQAIKMYK